MAALASNSFRLVFLNEGMLNNATILCVFSVVRNSNLAIADSVGLSISLANSNQGAHDNPSDYASYTNPNWMLYNADNRCN